MKDILSLIFGMIATAIGLFIATTVLMAHYQPELPLSTLLDINIIHENMKMMAYDGTLHLIGILIIGGGVLTFILVRAWSKSRQKGRGFEILPKLSPLGRSLHSTHPKTNYKCEKSPRTPDKDG